MFGNKPTSKSTLTDAQLLQLLKCGEAHTSVIAAALARILEKMMSIEEAREYAFPLRGSNVDTLCRQATKMLPESAAATIPSWCPLPDAPAPVEKRCGTCRWWERNDFPGTRLGRCHVPISDLLIPAWVDIRKWANSTGEHSGTYCPVWEAKP